MIERKKNVPLLFILLNLNCLITTESKEDNELKEDNNLEIKNKNTYTCKNFIDEINKITKKEPIKIKVTYQVSSWEAEKTKKLQLYDNNNKTIEELRRLTRNCDDYINNYPSKIIQIFFDENGFSSEYERLINSVKYFPIDKDSCWSSDNPFLNALNIYNTDYQPTGREEELQKNNSTDYLKSCITILDNFNKEIDVYILSATMLSKNNNNKELFKNPISILNSIKKECKKNLKFYEKRIQENKLYEDIKNKKDIGIYKFFNTGLKSTVKKEVTSIINNNNTSTFGYTFYESLDSIKLGPNLDLVKKHYKGPIEDYFLKNKIEEKNSDRQHYFKTLLLKNGTFCNSFKINNNKDFNTDGPFITFDLFSLIIDLREQEAFKTFIFMLTEGLIVLKSKSESIKRLFAIIDENKTNMITEKATQIAFLLQQEEAHNNKLIRNEMKKKQDIESKEQELIYNKKINVLDIAISDEKTKKKKEELIKKEEIENLRTKYEISRKEKIAAVEQELKKKENNINIAAKNEETNLKLTLIKAKQIAESESNNQKMHLEKLNQISEQEKYKQAQQLLTERTKATILVAETKKNLSIEKTKNITKFFLTEFKNNENHKAFFIILLIFVTCFVAFPIIYKTLLPLLLIPKPDIILYSNLQSGLSGLPIIRLFSNKKAPPFVAKYKKGDLVKTENMKELLTSVPESIKMVIAERKKGGQRIMLGNYMLCGPPGTGKTATVQAIVSEVFKKTGKVFFVQVSIGQLGKYPEEHALEALNQLFKHIEQSKRIVIVYLDECDAIFTQRGDNKKNTRLTNFFLERVQKAESKNIIFFGSTNRLNLLDDAFLRRFITYNIDTPNSEQIMALIPLYVKKKSIHYNMPISEDFLTPMPDDNNIENLEDLAKLKVTGDDIEKTIGLLVSQKYRDFCAGRSEKEEVTYKEIIEKIKRLKKPLSA